MKIRLSHFKKHSLALLPAFFLLFQCASPAAASSALDAFYELTAASEKEALPPASGISADDLLFQMLTEMYDPSTGLISSASENITSVSPAEVELLLSSLCAITEKDLTRFAAQYELPAALIRSLYYRTLADVLNIRMQSDPAAAQKYGNLASLLSLFLAGDAGTATDTESASVRETIRSEMTVAYSTRIAETFAVPETFVEYIIMEDTWDDGNWINDSDWARIRAQLMLQDPDTPSDDYFESLVIGSSEEKQSAAVVTAMQEALIRLGYLKGNADGVFGPRTQAALIEYQLANGIKPTGSYSYSDYISLQSSGLVPRSEYDDDFWDEDNFSVGENFDYMSYLNDLYDEDDDGIDGDDDDDDFDDHDDDYDDGPYDDHDDDYDDDDVVSSFNQQNDYTNAGQIVYDDYDDDSDDFDSNDYDSDDDDSDDDGSDDDGDDDDDDGDDDD